MPRRRAAAAEDRSPREGAPELSEEDKVRELMEITGIDDAEIARDVLRQNGWRLDSSVTAFLRMTGESSPAGVARHESGLEYGANAEVIVADNMARIAQEEEERHRAGVDQHAVAPGPLPNPGPRLPVPGHRSTLLAVLLAEELSEGTDNFAEAKCIGAGGFGKVYFCAPREGLASQSPLAVKKLNADGGQGAKEFHKEIQVLGAFRHPNLLPLLGFSADADCNLCLVYPLMIGGSLQDRIFPVSTARERLRLICGGQDPAELTWPQRLKILEGTCRGIEFLHTSDRSFRKREILHRDIKPSNILLDRDLEPRLSDVGMARDLAAGDSHAMTSTRVGTRGYEDPHIERSGRYDKKSDCFAFGVTMLQVLTNWPLFDNEHGDYGYIVDRCSRDPGLECQNSLPDGMWRRLLKNALDLVKSERAQRISVADARHRLEEEMRQLQPLVPAQESAERECIICMAAPREVRYGCGHSQVCYGCFDRFMSMMNNPRCSMCRQAVTRDSIERGVHIAQEPTFVQRVTQHAIGVVNGGRGAEPDRPNLLGTRESWFQFFFAQFLVPSFTVTALFYVLSALASAMCWLVGISDWALQASKFILIWCVWLLMLAYARGINARGSQGVRQ